MSEKELTKFLQALGLSKKETEVYMFLAGSGVQSASFAAKRLKMERVQAYRTFKKMQERGFIEATLERPARFTVVPLETLLESFINAKKTEINSLNEQKQSLLASWRTIRAPETEASVAKFLIVAGKKKILSKMLTMIEEPKKEILALTTGLGSIQEDIAGIFDAMVHSARKRNLRFQILTDISQENLRTLGDINKKISVENADVELRHINLNSRLFPCFLIKDEEEALLYASPVNESSELSLEDEGLWINDRMFVSILKNFFVQMWQTAADATMRIDELKTGTPLRETVVIKHPEEAWAKVANVLEIAKEEVVAITSSQGLNSILENDPFAKYSKNGVRFRIMASIDPDNLEAAKKLSNIYQIKHVPINFLTMMNVDDKNLFIFKSSPPNEWNSELPFYMGETFYTNDSRSIEKASEMLNDIWKRGVEVSEISAQAGMKLPTVEVLSAETVAEAVDEMLQNNVSSILITENQKPVGIITDKNLLKEMAHDQNHPRKTLIKDLKYMPVIALEGGDSIIDALKKMREKGMKRIAVVKNAQLVAMLTEDLA
jgi:sugar-specific transcriptional regulator TrmB/CBS domain-containing protein